MMKKLKPGMNGIRYVTTNILDPLNDPVAHKIYFAISLPVSHVSYRQIMLDGIKDIHGMA